MLIVSICRGISPGVVSRIVSRISTRLYIASCGVVNSVIAVISIGRDTIAQMIVCDIHGLPYDKVYCQSKPFGKPGSCKVIVNSQGIVKI